jgi:hypothetical protein
VVLRIECRASHLLDRCSTTSAILPALSHTHPVLQRPLSIFKLFLHSIGQTESSYNMFPSLTCSVLIFLCLLTYWKSCTISREEREQAHSEFHWAPQHFWVYANITFQPFGVVSGRKGNAHLSFPDFKYCTKKREYRFSYFSLTDTVLHH